MASEIREAIENKWVATGGNLVKDGDDYLIGRIAPYPNDALNHGHVGDIFKIKIKDEGGYAQGILLALKYPPSGGIMMATFVRPK